MNHASTNRTMARVIQNIVASFQDCFRVWRYNAASRERRTRFKHYKRRYSPAMFASNTERSLRLDELKSKFARRHAEACAECLVEVRQIVESAAVGNLGNSKRRLVRILECPAAGVQPRLEQPAAERLSKRLEA